MDVEAHWDNIGTNYNEEIFDVYLSDRNKKLPKYFKKHSNPDNSAIDFGCGIGKSFPFIAPLFKKIIAIDISQELLNQAQQTPFKNITFRQEDLTQPDLKLPSADFAFCCNVIMFPEMEKNFTVLRNIERALKPGGKGIVVLPSLDSILFASLRLIEVYKREGVEAEEIPSSEFIYFKGDARNLIQGIVHLDNVPTKHYTESEIRAIFNELGLSITEIDKIEYNWDTEMVSPPDWLKDPYPWDWLVEFKKD
jgi:SAM-dependent methyltransferase